MIIHIFDVKRDGQEIGSISISKDTIHLSNGRDPLLEDLVRRLRAKRSVAENVQWALRNRGYRWTERQVRTGDDV